MRFDPMTGEPIKEEAEEPMQFDPMTGQPVNNGAQETAQFDPMAGQPVNNGVQEPMQFDPMTGQLVYNNAGGGTQFDPMTGQPVYNNAGGGAQFDPMTGQPVNNGAQEPMQFDPMTGQPVYNNAGGGVQFDPMTGKPVQQKSGKKSKLPKILGIVCASVAVIAVIAVVLINLLMPSSTRVYIAAANTFKDMPYFAQDLLPLAGIAASDKVTAGVSVEYKDNNIATEVIKSTKEIQAVASLDNDDVSDFKVIADIDDKALSIYAPKLDSRVFVYDYTQKNDGYIADMLGSELDDFNDLLKSINSQDDIMLQFSKDMANVMIKEIKKANFEKIDSEVYTVNGKEVKCKGYQLKIDDKLVKSILSSMKKEADNKEYEEALSALTGQDIDMGDLFDELMDEADDMEDIKLSVYISGNKLAAAILEMEDNELEIEFKGGDYRTQNIKITEKTSNGKKYTYKLKGSMENKTETLEFSADSKDLCTLEYNVKSGEFDLEVYPGVSVEGTLKSSASAVELEITSGVSGKIAAYVKKGAKFESMKGKKFDLGKADEDDLEDLVDDLEDAIEDADLEDVIRALGWSGLFGLGSSYNTTYPLYD